MAIGLSDKLQSLMILEEQKHSFTLV